MKTRQSVRVRDRRVGGPGLHGVEGRVPSRGVNSDALYNVWKFRGAFLQRGGPFLRPMPAFDTELMKETLCAKCGIAYESLVVPIAVEVASVLLDDSSLIPDAPC